MSDSVKFKQYLRRMLHPTLTDRIISTVPIHFSHDKVTVETIKDTLFDFMLLSNAKFIKTHSVYGWISGFVQWVSHIFNVPLINIKSRPQSIQRNLHNSNPTNPSQLPMKPMKPMKQMKLMKPMQLMRINSPRVDFKFNKIF